jgi:sulfonate transport system permease protein
MTAAPPLLASTASGPTTNSSPTTSSPTTAGPVAARKRRRRPEFLFRAISPLALVLLWQLASSAGLLSPRKLAAPTTVLRTGWQLTRDGELPTALLVSVQRVAAGFGAGVTVGLALGLVAGLSRWGEYLTDPPIQMVRTLPHLGLVPLFILWFGIGESPKIALIALGAAFPVYLNVFAGIRGTDANLLEAARTLGLGRAQRIVHVVLPSALPSLLVGLRYALGLAWLSLIVAEQVNTSAGLGYLISNAREFLRTDVVVVGLAVYSLLGLGTDALVRFVERRALAWRRSILSR